jgi:hypothetical protein
MEKSEVSVLEKLMVFGNVCRFALKSRINDSWLEALEIGEAEKQNQVYDLWFFKHMNGSKQRSSEVLRESWVFNILPREIQGQIRKVEPEKWEEIIEEAVEKESQFCIFVMNSQKPGKKLLDQYYKVLGNRGSSGVPEIAEISAFPSALVKDLTAQDMGSREQMVIQSIWMLRFQEEVELTQRRGSEFYDQRGDFKGPLIAKAWYPFNLKYIVSQFNTCRVLRAVKEKCNDGEERAGHCYCRGKVLVRRMGIDMFWPEAKHQRNCRGENEKFQKQPRKRLTFMNSTVEPLFDASLNVDIEEEMQSERGSKSSPPPAPLTETE